METSVLGLAVRTASGHTLGRVIGVTVDPATHGVLHYEVRSTRLPGLGQTHLIAPAQVQSITEEEIIVDDALSPQASPRLVATT